SPVRGPAVLSNAQLEQVRDELLAIRSELHERVTRRAVDRMSAAMEPETGPVGIIERLRRRLRGQA
ncbi:hypothetical protein, partial [Paraconexibacter sp.]|uniref:hypothetical protein n=1 Tax=Paraconexibacter sp. TaxID=2949640 RepID=UPI00356A3013